MTLRACSAILVVTSSMCAYRAVRSYLAVFRVMMPSKHPIKQSGNFWEMDQLDMGNTVSTYLF